MASAAAEQIPSPPTYRFRPTKRELVEFYLLPRARGQDPFPGVIFEDDAAGSTLPWDLFERHGVGRGEDEAYFLVRGSNSGGDAGLKKRGARQDRACDGGVGTWKMQSSHDRHLRVRGGERVRVHVSNLNLHMGKGKNSSGSVGWVMHEYTIAAPPCPSPVKICHIAFSGHGRKRMRVPDGQLVRQSALPGPGSSDFQFQGFPSLAASEQYYPGLEAQVSATEQQDIVAAAPQLMAQESAMPVAPQLSAAELEFWSSLGVDVQSDNSFEQEQSTGVQGSCVVPNTDAMVTGVRSSCVVSNNGAMATGVQSSWVVPNIDAMATGVRSSWVAGDLDAFCRSVLRTNVQTNCAAPEFGNMATGTLGGGCSLICK